MWYLSRSGRPLGFALLAVGGLGSSVAAQSVRAPLQLGKGGSKAVRIEQRIIPYELGFEYTANRFRAVALASEFYMAPGGIDWSGDGDPFDDVIIEHELATGVTQVIGIDAASLALGSGFMAMTRLEASSDVDFNGDGDYVDSFLFIRNNVTGALSMGRPALSVWDAAGDFIDTYVDSSSAGVHELHSVSAGTHRRFRAAHLSVLDPFGAVYRQSELFAGDINGDGDTEDRLAVACSDPAGPVVFSDVSIDSVVLASPEWVLCRRSELSSGGDQNGDGDIFDDVLIAMERATGTTRIAGVMDAEPLRQYQLAGRYLFLRNTEGFSGDQNADGDTDDKFLEAIDLATGQRRSWSFDGAVVASIGNTGLVLIPETELGVDVTGNGNMNDWIAHVADHGSGTLRPLGFAGDPGESGYLTAGHAVFHLPEVSLGTPLNGDMDTFDNVMIAINLANGRERIVPHRLLDLAPPAYPNGTVGFQVHEDFAYDLNGDAVATDRTAGVLTLASGEITLGRGSGPRWVQGAGGNYLYTVDENILGADVDGNGVSYNWLGGIFVVR